MRMIDIHCHILPGVDDGPKNIKEACAMLDDMREDNVCAIVATPHYRPEMFEASRTQVLRSYRIVREEAMERGIKLFLGTELYRHSEMEEILIRGERWSMAGTKFVLVEFSGIDIFMTIRNECYSLITKGYIPILAHIERYMSCREIEKVEELKNMGVYIQINSDTILGKFGYRNQWFARKLLKKGLVDFVASDAHDRKQRRSSLAECAEYVKKKYGPEVAKKLFYRNPVKMINSGRSK